MEDYIAAMGDSERDQFLERVRQELVKRPECLGVLAVSWVPVDRAIVLRGSGRSRPCAERVLAPVVRELAAKHRAEKVRR